MKVTGILIIAVLLLVCTAGNSQTINFSGKNIALVKVFASIKKQTGTVFFYDEALIKDAKPVTINLKDASLETALNEIFKDQPLSWSLEDKTVTISRKQIPDNSSIPIAQPQSFPVRGTITDANGNPLSEVSVTVKGNNRSAITDINGKFSINASEQNTLIFSSVSYITKEIKVENREMNIALELEIKPLESLIIGGNFSETRRKVDATTVTVIDSKTLEKIPVNTIDQIFRGWVPGTNNFDQGSSPEGLLSLSIRGAGGSSSVAHVAVYIDGIEYAGGSGYLCQLDKTDIDRIEIVRGPGASTLYGTGSNGGIVQIFTKKGKTNQTVVNFSAGAGFYKSTWVPENAFQQQYNLDLTTGFQKVALTLGASYRTIGAYLPDGGEKNKGFYLDARLDLGKFQVNIVGRHNVRNFSYARDPIYDTTIHPRTDITITNFQGLNVPAYEWLGVKPSKSLFTDGITETYITGVNLSHKTTDNWVNNLEAGYTSNDIYEIPVPDGITPLQRQYQTIKNNITTLRYFNTLMLAGSDHDIRATIMSGLEYKNYSNSVIWTRPIAANNLLTKDPDNKNYGAFVQISPSYKNIYLTMGLRYEKNELFTSALNPRVGLTTNFDIRSLTIKPRISWGKGITVPTYSDRFGKPANVYTVLYPNPEIKPQSQQGFDYGVDVYDKKGRYKFEVVYYDNLLKDMITQIGLGTDINNPNIGAFMNVNSAEVVNRGWEFSGQYLSKRFTLQGTISIINAKVEDTTGSYRIPQLSGKAPGTRMYNLPQHTAGLNFTYSFFKLFGKNDRCSFSVSVTEVDGVIYYDHKTPYLDIAYGRADYATTSSPYQVETPAVFRVGLFADYQILPVLRFFVQGSNILNDYNFENSIDYPTHGAAWLFGVKYNFVKTAPGN